jgi:threonine/homoserine/homoserine lactone efflux protein
MPLETLLALAGILLAACWTPGPNNAMLAASGATFGFRRTLPHMQGVAWGFPLMLFAVALGLGEVFRLYPVLHEVLRWGGAALLLWVAWRIATAASAEGAAARARPFTFWQAAGFQWINPKAWVMCAGIVAQFVTGQDTLRDATICAVVAGLVGLTSATGWAAFGAALADWLRAPGRLQVFNAAMAGTIVLGVVWLIGADL